MTSNQLRYWEISENKRANYARERENIRSNLAKEGLSRQSNFETARHNKAVEGETSRSNLARETETRRSNMANELLTETRNAETARSNRANERISSERNRISSASVAASKYAADKHAEASRYSTNTQARIAAANLAETTRSNKERELIGYLGEGNKLLSTIANTGVKLYQGGVSNERAKTTRELIKEATDPSKQKSWW